MRRSHAVTTPQRPVPDDGASRWDIKGGGFWRPGPYLELTRTFLYANTATDVRQSLIVEPDGRATVYRIWKQAYSPETISAVLAAQKFSVRSVWSDLAGAPYVSGGHFMGIVSERPPGS